MTIEPMLSLFENEKKSPLEEKTSLKEGGRAQSFEQVRIGRRGENP